MLHRWKFAVAAVFLGWSLIAVAGQNPADLVDPLIGTANEGQTFPAAGVPFAMTQWTPATRETQKKAVAPYYYEDTQFRGFRGSHFLSGSATQEYGSVQIMMGAGEPDFSQGVPSVEFSHSNEKATPYSYRLRLPESGVSAALTGTERCGFLQLQFAKGGQNWVLVKNLAMLGDGEIAVDAEKREITSRSAVRRLYAGQGKLAGISGYAVVEFDHPFTVGGTVSGTEIHPEGTKQESTQGAPGGFVFFQLKPGEMVRMRIGTSFTSLEEARKNLRAEIPAWDFAAIERKAAAAWNAELGEVSLTGSATDQRIFYTALYHTMLLPRIASDASGTYPRFAGGASVEKAEGHVYYDDFSIWDTFRAVHPLFTILDPRRDGEMVQSLIDKGEQGGWLPIFPAWGSYTSEMDGDHGVAVIGDAYLKGIKGFDIERGYAIMRKTATEIPEDVEEYRDGKGLRALPSYLKYGYIPLEDPVADAFHHNEQVARTLDYAFDDFVLGKVAAKLGKTEDAAMFAKRAQNYRNVIDPETGFARGRHEDGTWITPFDPTEPATYVTEGLPYQYSFYVLQDLKGLIELEHGNEPFVAKLDELFKRDLYEHGNEPSHHIAYLYDYAGASAKTQEHVHQIVSTHYTDGPKGLAGNDDAGQMSAWYCFSALGFYPVTPGSGVYAIGTPRFPGATLRLPNGKIFRIVAQNLSEKNFYIRRVTLNGAPLNRFWLRHEEIQNGGRLVFEMTDQPSTAWPASAELPE